MNKIEQETMTDMRREAFERWAGDQGFPVSRWMEDSDDYQDLRTQTAFDSWTAALRYRDEQEKGDGTG